MGKAGRKSWTEELKLQRRYADLTEDYFRVVKELLESDSKEDNKFAVQQLSKAFVKMIPQTLAGDQDNPIVIEGVEITVRK